MAAHTSDPIQPIAIVTGANTGIGYETALALCRKGYHVVLACRNTTKGDEAAVKITSSMTKDGLKGLARCMAMDLTDLGSVASFAAAFSAEYPALHCTILNAGMNVSPEHTPARRRTVNGFELCMQSNYIGHFLLTKLLLPLMLRTARDPATAAHGIPCRIVTLGSVAHRLVYSRSECSDWRAVFTTFDRYTYNVSKIACIMLAYELQRQFDNDNITEIQAVCANPGAVMSDIWRHLPDCLHSCLRPAMALAFLTTEQGAAPSIAAATAREIDGVRIRGGEYIVPYHIRSSWSLLALACEAIGPFAGPKITPSTHISYDIAIRTALMQASEEAVKPFLDVAASKAK